ncbi:MAG: response regulator transcription factor [Undibacterium sp.]|nr:response regulator transcription factor [Opitutaceae bacterium]
MNTTRILLVDDHTLVRAGIRALLEKLPDVTIVGEANDGREALALLPQARPHVLLTDIAMHGLGGLALVAQVVRDHPEVKVLILSMHANEEYVIQALQSGAVGYLLKDAVATELGLALAALTRGETYLSPAISRRVLDAYLARTTGGSTAADPLTPRQRETLRLIAEGKNTKEIAHELGVSVKTVETHRAQLMERLGIHEVAGLVKYALHMGIIE